MKSKVFARRVNAARPDPVIDPHGTGRTAAPAPDPPACPACGSEALWFFDPEAARAEPVCLDCAPPDQPSGAPAAIGPSGGPTTTDQIMRYARAYADEHFPNWADIAVRIRLGRAGGERGELLLVLTKPPSAPGPGHGAQTRTAGVA